MEQNFSTDRGRSLESEDQWRSALETFWNCGKLESVDRILDYSQPPAHKSDISGQLTPIQKSLTSVRMIGTISLDFLFAMAARFGNGQTDVVSGADRILKRAVMDPPPASNHIVMSSFSM